MVKNTELTVPGFCEITGTDDNGDDDNDNDVVAALEVG